MDVSILDAAGQALLIVLEPHRILLLSLGVIAGLAVGIIPGIGAAVAIAIMLPFTFAMEPYSAFAFMLGLAAVTATADPISAILFGVPGSSAAQSTILDGHAMAKKGEAGRALSAAYTASLFGGLAGAVLMAISIPVLRPFILSIGAPELMAFALFGVSMVALLSGSAPLRGLVAGCIGVLLSLVGSNPQTGTLRWTFDSLYLWDGIPLVPVILGLFAVPELCDLFVRRQATAGNRSFDVRSGMVQGVVDTLRNWWLVIRCSWIGTILGAIPGVSGAVVSWVSYGHALSTVKDARKTFAKGDVRGVIAPEAANNSAEGGQLVPALAFGVPTSAAMAILMSAFMAHGLVMGPEMLGKNLHVTYSMVWSLALANVVGAALCFAFSSQFAKLTTLRYSIIVPVILCVVVIGGFQESRHWGDLFVVLSFGIVGWIMKQLRWPRPPLVLGLILGFMIEQYGFVSIQRYGLDWIYRPVVLVLLAIALYTFLRPLIAMLRAGGAQGLIRRTHPPRLNSEAVFTICVLAAVGYLLWEAVGWDARSRTVPVPVALAALAFGTMSLIGDLFFREKWQPKAADAEVKEQLHMDSVSDFVDLPGRTVLTRSILYFGWLVGFGVSMALVGFLPTIALFITAFMRVENKESWKVIVPIVVAVILIVYVMFGQLLGVPFPDTVLGTLIPALQVIPSV